MKKIFLTLTFIFLILTIAACGSQSSEGESTTDNTNSGNTDPEFNMPPEMQLMLGTVALDETDHAVDSDQAAELLPLWKALRSLSESGTTAQAEIDAIITQIGETMTDEQMAAIEEMGLTMQDFGTVAETLGIETGVGGGRFGEMTPEMQATAQAMRESGQRPGGDLPGGGQGPGGGFGGAEMDPDARATAMAERSFTGGRGFGINTALLDGIIEFLVAKIQ